MVNFLAQKNDGSIISSQISGNALDATSLSIVSLNLTTDDIASLSVSGQSLLLTLTNGEVFTIESFMQSSGFEGRRLLLSANGETVELEIYREMQEVTVASFVDVEVFEMLSFEQGSILADIAPVIDAAPAVIASNDSGFLLPLGAGVLGLGFTSSSPAGSRPSAVIEAPTVETGSELPSLINGTNQNTPIVFSGQGEPGATVVLVLDGIEYEGFVDDAGEWSISIDPADLPGEGIFDVVINSYFPGGPVTTIDGGQFTIDFTPPEFSDAATTSVFFENVGANNVVGQATATDSYEVTFSIVPQEGDQSEYFSIDPQSGEITLLHDPDHEVFDSYQITVAATDENGNVSHQRYDFIVNDVPEISDINIDISSGNDANFGVGSTISAQIEFDGVVDVDLSEGTPTFELMVGGMAVPAVYVSGAGTDTLVFEYVVEEGVNAEGEVSIGNQGILLNGAVIVGGDPLTAADISPDVGIQNPPTIIIDTTPPQFNVTLDLDNADAPVVLNIVQVAFGFELSGNAEDGSSIEVSLAGGATLPATAMNGEWSVFLSADQLMQLDDDPTVVLVATDAAGNTTTVQGQIAVDLDRPEILADQLVQIQEDTGADNVVVQITASDEYPVTFSIAEGRGDDAGYFSIDPQSGDVILLENPDHEGRGSYHISVIATDANGNSSEQAIEFAVQNVPEVVDISLDLDEGQVSPITVGEGIVAEVTFDAAVNVFTNNGTPLIELSIGDSVFPAIYVSGSGTDTIRFEYVVQDGVNIDGEIGISSSGILLNGGSIIGGSPPISADLELDASVDGGMNVVIDTSAPDVNITGQFSPDNTTPFVLNIADIGVGFDVTGYGEVGTHVIVEVAGVSSDPIEIVAPGNWTAYFSPEQLTGLTDFSNVSVTATDAAGNSTTVDGRTIEIDTTPPQPISLTTPLIQGENGTVFGISYPPESGVDYSFFELSEDGETSPLGVTSIRSGVEFDRDLPDGSDLYVSAVEAGTGNSTNSILFFTEDAIIDGAQLTTFDESLNVLDLSSADDAQVEISAEELIQFSSPIGNFMIVGGEDDALELEGFVNTNETVTVSTDVFAVYQTLDGERSVMVDDDIGVTMI